MAIRGQCRCLLDIDRASNDSTDHSLSLSTRAETDRWRSILDVDYQRATLNSETTSEHSESSYKLDRLWGEHLFWRGAVVHRDDAFATIWRTRGLELGIGYRLADSDSKRFDLTAGLGRFKFDLDSADIYVNAVLLEWDYRWKLFGSQLEVFSDGQLALPDVEGIDYVGSDQVRVPLGRCGWRALEERTLQRGPGSELVTQRKGRLICETLWLRSPCSSAPPLSRVLPGSR